MRFIILVTFARVGEASNPGPILGTTNPSGALGKGDLYSGLWSDSAEPQIWGISESHLTEAGLAKFRQELKFQGSQWKVHHGAPAPAMSQNLGTTGGKAGGVAVLTNTPVRALATDWDPSTWATSRVLASAVFVQNNWIKVGTFYGYARDAHTKATKTKTDDLLQSLTQRIVLQSRGYRVILGDFNATTADLPQFDTWRQHGFRELQEIAATKWGREIDVTCKKTSTKDLVWLSPELITKLESVHVDSTYFPDHSIVYGKFADLDPFVPVPIWFKPHRLPWDEIPSDYAWPHHAHKVGSIPEVFHAMEQQVDCALRDASKPGLLHAQKGRCSVVAPTFVHHPVAPLKPSRRHEFQIEYMGESYQHVQWCRQLRRLQSLLHVLRKESPNAATVRHRHELWKSIRGASGFPGGFPKAWFHRGHVTVGAPVSLPKQVPSPEQAMLIFQDFQAEFKALEKTLIAHRRKTAKLRRLENTNAVYADVSKPRSMPVQSVVTKTFVQVTQISEDGLQVQYEPPTLCVDQEVSTEHGWLQIAGHEPGQINLAEEAPLEIGDSLTQDTMQASKHAVFRAFQELWEPRWQKHHTMPSDAWEPFVRRLKAQVPAATQTLAFPPIDATQWSKVVKAKKAKTAAGPDGVTREDLIRLPPALQDQLVSFINDCDSNATAWPEALMHGHITAIEKTPGAMGPQDFRPITILSWHRAVSSIQRHFIVDGSCSAPIDASTGYPEGDPLSVCAMVLLNIAMHYMVEAEVSQTRVVSFVDNWEAQSSNVEVTNRTWTAMESFAQLADLQLDHRKSYFWATTAVDRKYLIDHQRKVCHHSADLGGHVNYTRKVTNYTVRSRIGKTKGFWSQLMRSPAPQAQKLRAIMTVAWPRCLHGVAGVGLGAEHLSKLRSAMMQSMYWNKKGASPILQCLLLPPKCDPGFYATFDTLMMFRDHCNAEIVFPVLTALVLQPPRHFDPGPAGVFLSRIHQLNWQWGHNGYIVDHEGLQWHILDAPVQLLRARLKSAWAAMMGSLMESRQEYQGMMRVDVDVSRHTQGSFPADGQGLLRTAMNGTFYTRNKQIHAGKIPDKFCPFCTREDSVHHRIFECEAFSDLRSHVDDSAWAFLHQQPDCTKLHGWFVEGLADKEFRRALMDIPDTTGSFPVDLDLPEVVHMFTDGSCTTPQRPSARLATWAVSVAVLPDLRFCPVAAGGVSGLYHTTLRAEITSAIAAVRFGLFVRKQFWVWTDNDLVCKRIRAFASGCGPPTARKHDHDLWTQLHSLLTRAVGLGLFQRVVKVASHQRPDFSDVIEQWVFQGNEHADRFATEARLHLPSFLQHARMRLETALDRRYRVCKSFHSMLVQFGLRCVESKPRVEKQDEVRWDRAKYLSSQTEHISLDGIPRVLVTPVEHNLGDCLEPLHRWLIKLTTAADARPLWLSSYQLFAHFQATTAGWGFHYDAKHRSWSLADSYVDAQGFNFLKLAGWLQAIVKAFAKLFGLVAEAKAQLPFGSTIRCWQRCLQIRASPKEMEDIDGVFRAAGVSHVKIVSKAFGRFGPIRGVLQ
eukprot:s365_g3.t1